MTLKNLLGLSLDTVIPDKQTIQRLLTAAARHIAGGKVRAISAETRFASAYTAIRTLADGGLDAPGYRVLASKPGHHQTAIQTWPLTLGISSQVMVRLDYLRKQRNATEYSGDLVPETAVVECLAQAEALYATARAWLEANKKELT